MWSQGSSILTIVFVLGFGINPGIAQTAELGAKTILLVTLSGRRPRI